jgi:flagellar export protein FliJ
MADFQFRLARLLKLREATRDERRGELALAVRAATVLAEQGARLAEDVRVNRQRIRDASRPGELDVDALVDHHRHRLALVAQRQELDRQRAQLEAEIELRRQRLLESDREVKALEKLRTRKRDRFLCEQRRRETRQLDEVAARCGLKEDVS